MHQTLLGVTGPGKTFTMAHVIEAIQRPTVVLAPNKDRSLPSWYGEMRRFFPNNAVEYLRTDCTVDLGPTFRRPIPTSKNRQSTSYRADTIVGDKALFRQPDSPIMPMALSLRFG